MGDPWQDEGFAGDDDWDEGKESIETDVEDGFDDPQASEEQEESDEDEP